MPSFTQYSGSKKKIISLVVIVIVILLGWHFIGGKKATEEDVVKAPRGVSLALVSDLSLNSSPLPLLGTVSSRSEASIKAESSGRLEHVYVKLGDYVSAGEIIAEFDNSGERAAVLQAQGGYDAALAGASNTDVSTNIAEINSGSSARALENAKSQAFNTITSAFTTFDDAISIKTDTQFANPTSNISKYTVATFDSNLQTKIEQEHQMVEMLLLSRGQKNASLSVDGNLLSELVTIETEANTIKTYLDDLALGLTHSVPNVNTQAQIDGYKAATALARAEIAGTLSAITATKTALNAAMTGSQIAVKNLAQSSDGGQAAAKASIKSAQGVLNAAQSRLEKTIVRSPIGGTVNSLSVETGDFIPPFADVAVVSNNGALEVIAYATEDDAKAITVGGKVVMNDTVLGIITRIAPALDPKTKKIEVRIGIVKNGSELINGQSVRVSAARAHNTGTNKAAQIKIPLSALKITPTGSIIFTLSASSTVKAHQVKEGSLMGDQIVIEEGLIPEMMIVTDARGLRDGEAVTLTK